MILYPMNVSLSSISKSSDAPVKFYLSHVCMIIVADSLENCVGVWKQQFRTFAVYM